MLVKHKEFLAEKEIIGEGRRVIDAVGLLE